MFLGQYRLESRLLFANFSQLFLFRSKPTVFSQLRRENFYIADNYNSHLQILSNFSVYVLKLISKQNLHVGTCIGTILLFIF